MLKNFQEYPKEYEDLKRRPFEDTFPNNIFSPIGTREEYVARVRKAEFNISVTAFRCLVEHTWLGLNFVYRGKRRKGLYSNGDWYDRAYGYFMRQMVGLPGIFMTRSGWFYRIGTYLNDLFPGYLSHDPWEEPEYFKFPFENIGIDHMYFVYQMPERFNLLQIAEDRNMSYNEFYDFVVNYIYCANDRNKELQYVNKPKFRIKNHGRTSSAAYVTYSEFKPISLRLITTPPKYRYKIHG